eukprot:g13813.t1
MGWSIESSAWFVAILMLISGVFNLSLGKVIQCMAFNDITGLLMGTFVACLSCVFLFNFDLDSQSWKVSLLSFGLISVLVTNGLTRALALSTLAEKALRCICSKLVPAEAVNSIMTWATVAMSLGRGGGSIICAVLNPDSFAPVLLGLFAVTLMFSWATRKITPQMVVPVNQPPSPQLPAPGPMQPQISGPPLQLPSPNGTPPNGPQPQPGAPPSSNGGSISASPPGSLPPTPATPNGAPGIFGQARDLGDELQKAPPSSSAPGREPRSSPMSSAEVDAPLPRPISQQSMPRISTPEVTPEGKLDLVRKRESHKEAEKIENNMKDLGSSEASDRAAESEGSLHDPCIDDAGLGEGL